MMGSNTENLLMDLTELTLGLMDDFHFLHKICCVMLSEYHIHIPSGSLCTIPVQFCSHWLSFVVTKARLCLFPNLYVTVVFVIMLHKNLKRK